MAYVADKEHSRFGVIIVERSHCHFKSAVRRGEHPRLHPVVFVLLQINFTELVSLAVEENRVFRCRTHIAEAPADLKSENIAVFKSGASVAPVPVGVVRPDAPSPVKNTERIGRIENDGHISDFHRTRDGHTVYFLIVVELFAVPVAERQSHGKILMVGEHIH